MKLTKIFDVFDLNTLVGLILSIGSTYISIEKGWLIDFPLTIVGIAVVFPIVFSISGAYKRRELALMQYGIMKSNGRSMYFAARDWLRDKGPKAETNKNQFKEDLQIIFDLCNSFFGQNKEISLESEKKIYKQFSKTSQTIEGLRDRGLSGSEVSRVNAWLNRYMTSFEVMKHIYQYRTPRSLRFYSEFFIYVILIILGPFFALQGQDAPLLLTMLQPFLFATVLTGLDNIQKHLENPYDGIGEDDITINTQKFIENLE